MSRENDQKGCVYKKRNTVPKSILNFHSQERITSFSYQHSVSFTYGLQHYCFLGQSSLNQLCGLWQRSRQILTSFLDQNWLQLLGYWNKSVQERGQKCRIPTETKPFNGRNWFQPVYSTKKSTSCCSRELSHRTKFVSSSSIYTVQRHGWATKTCSQGGWRCGLPKQKGLYNTAAMQVGQPTNLLCSSSSIRTVKRGR